MVLELLFILLKKRIEFIHNLIIGGGDLTNDDYINLSKIKTSCFHSFGMTETISHIALRPIKPGIKNEYYECLNHVQIGNNNEKQLIISSKKLGIKSPSKSPSKMVVKEGSFG